MATYPLDGIWEFRLRGAPKGPVPPGLDLRRWRPARMPGTIHHALEKAKLIPDAYRARNEFDVQWVDAQDWEMRRWVRVRPGDVDLPRRQLVFEGIDTVAEVFLNGRHAGSSRNMFREAVFDVTRFLKPGDNEVRVVLKSPTAFSASEARKCGVPMPRMSSHFEWQTGESRPVDRSFIRKTQCHFGWDWGPCLPVSGLWLPARLECSGHPRIVHVTVRQEHHGPAGKPRRVELLLEAFLDATVPARGAVTFECAGKGVRVPVRLRRGENRVRARLSVDRPRLWWPAGQGEQPLYPLRTSWDDEQGLGEPKVQRLGLRTLELVTERDRSPEGRPAESFYFRVNGRPLFLKGADWIPPDAYEDRVTPGVVRHLLLSMAESHMNAVRVWGGGRYETDLFYDQCDELGILVWQDLMMACAVYPDTPAMMREFEAEARHQVRRLQSRACVALWCGDNENLAGLKHWWDRFPHFRTYRRMYRRLMTFLGRVCRREDPTRRFWVSSPSNGSFEGEPDDPDRGDVHYWKVWHGQKPFEDYRNVRPRFSSEFGFQSFPESATLDTVIPQEDRNVTSLSMEHHQRSTEGNARIANTMAREMPLPRDFDAFCRMTQLNQAGALKTAIEHWRRCKPWCMGTIYWQVNDNWPVASWSSIDYLGRWKALHHEAARLYAPLLVSLSLTDGFLEVWATSDLPRPLSLKGVMTSMTWDGRTVARAPLAVRLKAGENRRVARVSVARLLGGRPRHEVCVFARLSGSGTEAGNFLNLSKWKWARLGSPKVRTRLRRMGRGWVLEAKSGNVVPFFHASLEGFEGHFTGDGQVLEPGRTYRFPWVAHVERGAVAPTLAQARRALRVRSLWDLIEH